MTEQAATTQTQTESVTYTPLQAVQDVAALRDKLAETMPNIIPEFLKGDSVQALIDSIDQSRALYERIGAMQPKETEAEKPKEEAPDVPAGGATFTEDLSKLPASELIRRGLQARRA